MGERFGADAALARAGAQPALWGGRARRHPGSRVARVAPVGSCESGEWGRPCNQISGRGQADIRPAGGWDAGHLPCLHTISLSGEAKNLCKNKCGPSIGQSWTPTVEYSEMTWAWLRTCWILSQLAFDAPISLLWVLHVSGFVKNLFEFLHLLCDRRQMLSSSTATRHNANPKYRDLLTVTIRICSPKLTS